MKIASNTRLILKYANFMGFKKVRQRGTHMILRNNNNRIITLKRHAKNKTFSQYHLKDILSDLGSNLNEYINYLGIK